MIGIYKITSPNGKIYIGQSTQIERRWKDYRALYCKSQVKLYRSLKKYGPKNHKFEIIEECEVDKLIERETYWKLFYKVLEVPSLCCRIDGIGGNLSKETKDKISDKLKGIKKSKKTKSLISKSLKKKIYQFNLEGKLIKIWNSLKDAELKHEGNINRNLMGLTKQAGGFIWLRENEIDKLNDKINKIKNYINPQIGMERSEIAKSKISQSLMGKKSNYKQNNLDLELIKEQYKIHSTNQLAELNKLSIPTMLNYLKDNGIYEFRKNYMK